MAQLSSTRVAAVHYDIPAPPYKRNWRKKLRILANVRSFIIRVPHAQVVVPRGSSAVSLGGRFRKPPEPKLRRSDAVRRTRDPSGHSGGSGHTNSSSANSHRSNGIPRVSRSSRRANRSKVMRRLLHSWQAFRRSRRKSSRSSIHPNKVGIANNEQMELAQQRVAMFRLNSAVMRTDTYAHLIDMNLHRWVVWVMSSTAVLPIFYLPSTEHFTLGSVHDVSHRIQQVEDGSINADKNCSNVPTIETTPPKELSDAFELQQRRISQTKTIMPNPCEPSTSRASSACSQASNASSQPSTSAQAIANEAAAMCSAKVEMLAVIASNGSASSSIQVVSGQTAKHEFSSVLSADEAADQIEAVQEEEEEDDEGTVTGEDAEGTVTGSSQSNKSANAKRFFTGRSLFAEIFFMFAIFRYVIHLWTVLISQAGSSPRSIRYIWCPLLMDTLNVIATGFTAIWMIGAKIATENLIIGASSFLNPCTSFQQRIIRWLPRLFLFIHGLFIVTNLFGTVFVVLQEYEAGPFEVNGTLQMELQLPSPKAATSMSHWHLYETYWLPNFEFANNTGSKAENATVNATVNGTDGNVTCCEVTEESENLPFSFMEWPWIFWPDLFIRLYINFVLDLVKTFYFSIAVMLIVKSWQICDERRYSLGDTPNQTTQNRIRESVPVSSMSLSSQQPTRRARHRSSDCEAPSPVGRLNQENERISLLVQVHLEYLRVFNRIFLSCIILWTSLSLVRMVGIIEFGFCRDASIGPYDKISGLTAEPTLPSFWREFNIHIPEVPARQMGLEEVVYRWYEVFFLFYYSAIQGLDIAIVLIVLCVTQYYRRRLLRD